MPAIAAIAYSRPDARCIGSARPRSTQGMIAPFVEKQQRDGVISYGLSSYGYDARCSDDFMIFTNVDNAIVDPKDFSHQSFVERKTECLRHPAEQLRPDPHGRVSSGFRRTCWSSASARAPMPDAA